MLERIADIQGIGLLYQANGKPNTCQKATLVYADNGRGKSTLATIFRSAATGNAGLITACRTIDTSLRERFKLAESQRSPISRLIRDALEAGRIKRKDPNATSSKFTEYLPYWG